MLTQDELDDRVAVLKHFRQLLTEQRQKFNEYLVVLEKQEATIEKDNAEAALAYCELETQIVDSIATLQKVIQPVEAMYREIKEGTTDLDEADTEIPRLQTNLEKLQEQIASQNVRNRLLLDSHLLQVRNRIDGFKQIDMRKSIYADDSRTASRVQIDV
jgi:chromosome segregation ATPase